MVIQEGHATQNVQVQKLQVNSKNATTTRQGSHLSRVAPPDTYTYQILSRQIYTYTNNNKAILPQVQRGLPGAQTLLATA